MESHSGLLWFEAFYQQEESSELIFLNFLGSKVDLSSLQTVCSRRDHVEVLELKCNSLPHEQKGGEG